MDIGRFTGKLISAGSEIGVDLKARIKPLTEEEVKRIWKNEPAYNALMDYIDRIQTICTQIQAGIVDDVLAYHSYYAYVVYEHDIYEPFTDKLRQHYDDEEMGNEWKKTARRWKQRRKADDLKREKDRKRGRNNIFERLGMPKRVK